MSLFNSRSSHESLDFELNLAPIIDCFTVLITFMLVSASFLSIGVFDAGMSAASVTNESSPPEIVIQVELQKNHKLAVTVTGKTKSNTDIPSADEKNWNFERLNQELTLLKQTWPQTQSVILSAADETDYASLVQAMEQIRKVIPGILLGGM